MVSIQKTAYTDILNTQTIEVNHVIVVWSKNFVDVLLLTVTCLHDAISSVIRSTAWYLNGCAYCCCCCCCCCCLFTVVLRWLIHRVSGELLRVHWHRHRDSLHLRPMPCRIRLQSCRRNLQPSVLLRLVLTFFLAITLISSLFISCQSLEVCFLLRSLKNQLSIHLALSSVLMP